MNKINLNTTSLKKLFGRVAVRMALFTAIALVAAVFTDSSYALDAGMQAPDFHVITMDKKDISYYRDLKGKKPVYLVFWTTW